MRKKFKWTMTYIVARFCDTPGLPLPRSPMMFLVPQILRRATTSHPHPSGEGRGARILVGDATDRAHIPQHRGGANGGV